MHSKSPPIPALSLIEPLEARIAPAAVVIVTDIDGDTIAVKTSKGTSAQLTVALKLSGMGLSGTIREIDFSTVALVGGVNPFAGTDLSVTVVTQGATGDGRVHVGYIDASSSDGAMLDGVGIALGNVKIAGDLGQIDAGLGGTNVAIKSLTVQSLGALGGAAQGGNGSTVSNLPGKVGKIKIAGSMSGATFAFAGPVAGLDIAGSFLDSALSGSGDLAKVRIGAGTLGASFAANSITAMEVKGTLGGTLALTGNLGTLKVAGDLLFAKVTAMNMKSVTIVGSVFGLDGLADSGSIVATGNIGKITVAGDLRGGSAANSGRVFAGGNIDALTIGGSLIGPVSAVDDFPSSYKPVNASTIRAGGDLKSVRIGGNILGPIILPVQNNSTYEVIDCCTISAAGDILKLSIGGSIVGISGDRTGTSGNVRIFAKHLDSLTVGGDIAGTSASFIGPEIWAQGGGTKAAIGKFSVGGSLRFASVLAGTTDNRVGTPRNADGQIGAVTIRGNLIASSLGVLDVAMGVTDDVNVVSRIASVTIGGLLTGGSTLRAEHIVAVKLGGVALKLLPGERTDTTAFTFPPGSGSIAEIM